MRSGGGLRGGRHYPDMVLACFTEKLTAEGIYKFYVHMFIADELPE